MKRHKNIHAVVQESFLCSICKQRFSRADNLKQHMKSHENLPYHCIECELKFASKQNLMRHMRSSHGNRLYNCEECDSKFKKKSNLKHHMRVSHIKPAKFVSVKKKRSTPQSSRKARKVTESLGVFKTVLIEPEKETMFDLTLFYEASRNELREILEEIVEEKQAIKWHLLIKVILERGIVEGEEEFLATYFHGDTYPQFTIDSIEENLEQSQQKIIKSFEKFIRMGSGWQLKEIKYYELKTAKYSPLRVAS